MFFQETKLFASVYPPFIFGMFVAKGQVVAVIVLAILAIVLAVVSIIYATKVLKNKTK